MNWFKKLFKKEEPKLDPGAAWVHISKLRKAEKIIMQLREQLKELQPKTHRGWPKGKPRKTASQQLIDKMSKK